jgi:hypothetical protein
VPEFASQAALCTAEEMFCRTETNALSRIDSTLDAAENSSSRLPKVASLAELLSCSRWRRELSPSCVALWGADATCPGTFTCCSGQASCGGAVNDPAVCNVLCDLYYSTNGGGWINNGGWASAAAGNVTDYCGFWMNSGNMPCSVGVLTRMYVFGRATRDSSASLTVPLHRSQKSRF